MFAGYPTNEERLILGLGLGGSGQDIDNSAVLPPKIPLSIITSQVFLKVNASSIPLSINRKRRSVYGDGTRCPHRNSTGEVCQHLSGMYMLKFVCMHEHIIVSI